MRHAHTIRLTLSDAAALDFKYQACRVLDTTRYALASYSLNIWVSKLCAARLPEALPPGWGWSYAGRTLYISIP
jgi:hypothetical protein